MQHDPRRLADTREGLHRRLSVEIDRDVDDLPAVLQAVGRRVGPSAGQIEPRGRTAPDDLVVEDVAGGLDGLERHFRDHELA